MTVDPWHKRMNQLRRAQHVHSKGQKHDDEFNSGPPNTIFPIEVGVYLCFDSNGFMGLGTMLCRFADN